MPTLLDQYGKPIDMRAIREPQTAMTAHLSTEFESHPAKGLTPQRINAILTAAEQGDLIQQVELADDMEERDGQIYSELAKRKTALIKLDWDVVPPDDADTTEKKVAEQVKAWIKAIPDFKRTVLHNMMDGVLKGFANIEMWWSLTEGTLQPQFAFRPQRWFTLNEARTQITLRNTSSSYGEALRPYNWIAHRHPSRNGYVARSALCRVLMLPYLYKNFSTRDFAEFLEIYGLPLRLGKFPAGASDEEKRRLLAAVVGIGHNAAGIVPMGMEIDFENAASGNEAPFGAMLDRMDAIESKIILGQTLTSSEGQHGTQALGNVHNDIRLDILSADAELVSETLTKQLVAPLALLNIAGVNPKRLPRFQIEVPEPEDIALFAEALPKLASAGMLIGVDWAHTKLRIPKAQDNEEKLKGAPEPVSVPGTVPPAGPGVPNPGRAALSANLPNQGAPGAPQDALDALVNEAVDPGPSLVSPLVQPLLDALDAALASGESLASFRDRLPELMQTMDSDQASEQLARAAFMARLAGTVGQGV